MLLLLMAGRLIHNELQKMWNEAVVACSELLPIIGWGNCGNPRYTSIGLAGLRDGFERTTRIGTVLSAPGE
jgi:hypothetical protein